MPITGLTFDTARLHVRPLCDTDGELFSRLFCDADIMRFIGPPFTPERAAEKFRSTVDAAGPSTTLTAIERTTGHAIGICSLHATDQAPHLAETGMMVLPQFQKRGYVKECLTALVTQAFARLPVDEIRVRIAVAHPVAHRVAASIGFRRRSDLDAEAGRPDLHVWSISRGSWPTMISERGEADAGTHRLP